MCEDSRYAVFKISMEWLRKDRAGSQKFDPRSVILVIIRHDDPLQTIWSYQKFITYFLMSGRNENMCITYQN